MGSYIKGVIICIACKLQDFTFGKRPATIAGAQEKTVNKVAGASYKLKIYFFISLTNVEATAVKPS